MNSPQTQRTHLAFIVADHSVDPADQHKARCVMDKSYFGARIWIRYATRSQAFTFRDIVGYRRERLYVVLKEAVPHDPNPKLLKASPSAKKVFQPAAASADWNRPLRLNRESAMQRE